MEGNWSSQISWLRCPQSEGPIQAGMECAGEQTPADPDKKRTGVQALDVPWNSLCHELHFS